MINKNSNITIKNIAALIGITERNIEKNIKVLKDDGKLLRLGSKKEGYWEIVVPLEMLSP